MLLSLFRIFPRIPMLLVAGLVILTGLVPPSAWTQEAAPGTPVPNSLSVAERARLLAERDRLIEEVIERERAGRIDEAIAVILKVLSLEREVLGGLHDDVLVALEALAGLHERREDWVEAGKALKEVLDIRKQQPDAKDWRIADTRRALTDLERRAAWTPDQRRRWDEGRKMNTVLVYSYKQGKYGDALEFGREALRLRQETSGRDHPDYAESLNNLALLYGAMGDNARAEPLYREALAIGKQTLGERHPEYATSLNNLAELYRATGDSSRAEPLCRQALEIRKQALGEHHPDYVASLNNLALLYGAMGDYARAGPLYREALAIGKQTLGERHPTYAASLNNLGLLYKTMGDYARAEPLYREALEIWKRKLGERHPDYVKGLNNLATLYREMGDYGRAEPLYREALEIWKGTLGESHPDYATSLNNLAELYKEMGDYARAEPLFREALEIRKRMLGEHHPDYATSLNNLATLYEAKGDYGHAEPLHCEAMAIRKQALGERHPTYAASLNNLGLLYKAMGDYARAEPLYRQAMAIWKQAPGERHPDYALGLNNLAALYKEIGAFGRAESLYREALATRKEALGERHPTYAASLNNLAGLYQAMGDSARAEPLYRQALEIRKGTLGERHPDYAASLYGLAGLYWAMGDYARAEPLSREAQQIWKRTLGERHPIYATSLNNLAILYHDMGVYGRAESLYREALEITKQTLGERHPDYAMSLNNLADLYQAMGDSARAEPLYLEALGIDKRALGERHPNLAGILNNLASLYQARGDLVRAEPLFLQALEITSTFMQDTASALGERQRLRLFGARRYLLNNYLSVALEAGARPADLYRHVLDWKGAVVACSDEDLLARDQPELGPTLAQLAQVRGRLAHLAFTTPAEGQRTAWREQLDALGTTKEGLEADLAARSAAFRRQRQARQLGPDEVTAALPGAAALVDLIEYTHFSAPEGGKGPLRREVRLLAFVLGPGQPVVVVPLGPTRPVDEAVHAWRRALEEHQTGALQEAADSLGRRVWGPLRPHLEGVRTVLITPDGELMRFPFAALPGSRPGSYLIEDLAIGYIGSGRQAAEVLAKPLGLTGHGLLAVGGVDFQADPGQASPTSRPVLIATAGASRAGFRLLKASGPEAQRACDLFHAAFADQPAALLMKAEPTEAELKRRLDGGHWRVIHLATHGFFESPVRVVALGAAVRREEPLALSLPAGKAGDDDLAFELTPLLRSGIVLVGGGRDPDAGPLESSTTAPREDGILTAEEVQALDLRGCELVVLSACDTGLGALEHGQGVLGLQRAFQAAGVRAVVASLWKVNDAATGVLMEQFYTNLWVKKLPKLEALQQAQLWVLNNPGLVKRHDRALEEKAEKLPDGGRVVAADHSSTRSDPALWAAFVLGGDVR